MSEAVFLEECAAALENGHFRRLILARPAAGELRKSVQIRPLQLRGESLLQLTHRFPTRDEAENALPAKVLPLISTLLGSHFLDANLETETASLSLRFSRKGVPHLSRRKITTETTFPVFHDRKKNAALDPARLPWLADLGLADAQGRILPSRSAKWRQVGRFIELIGHAWSDVEWTGERPLEIYDMGCGKGYLTFAVEAWFTDVASAVVQVHGVEQRAELVDFCNLTAQKHQRSQLAFQIGQIGETQADHLDVLIALHACNLATDDALALGIRRGAQMIVCAPCCQHELREKMPVSAIVSGLLEHGLFRQRQAALLTDAIRTLLLEREGYRVRVVEFVSSEHTDKNLLLIATRSTKKDPSAQSKIDQLKTLFALPELYLETLLP